MLLVSYSDCQELAKALASLPIPSSTHLPVQVVVSFPTSSQLQKNPSTITTAKTFKHKYKNKNNVRHASHPNPAGSRPPSLFPIARVPRISLPPESYSAGDKYKYKCRFDIRILLYLRLRKPKNELQIQNVAAPGSLLPAASSSYLGSTAGQSAKIGRGEDDQG